MKNNTVVAPLENIYWHTPTAELTDFISLTTHPGLHEHGELKSKRFSFLPLCDIFEDTGNLIEFHVVGETTVVKTLSPRYRVGPGGGGERAQVFLTPAFDMICEQKWKCESYNHTTVIMQHKQKVIKGHKQLTYLPPLV